MKYLINNLSTDWNEFLNCEFKKEYFIKIDNFLYKNQNNIIFPSKDNIFRCFDFFNINQTKVVIFGQDPYINDNQAIGLCFGINKDANCKIPPSLKNIAKELKNDLNIDLDDFSLIKWAKQGVLLLNTKLTVFKSQANSHKNIGWEFFIDNVIERLNNLDHQIVFLLMGNDAKKLKGKISNKHIIVQCAHPSPLSCNKGFFNSKIFSIINSYLIDKIKW